MECTFQHMWLYCSNVFYADQLLKCVEQDTFAVSSCADINRKPFEVSVGLQRLPHVLQHQTGFFMGVCIAVEDVIKKLHKSWSGGIGVINMRKQSCTHAITLWWC